MKPIAIIKMLDIDETDEAFASVRCGNGKVALALSILTNGDVEVSMSKSQAAELADALLAAVRQA